MLLDRRLAKGADGIKLHPLSKASSVENMLFVTEQLGHFRVVGKVLCTNAALCLSFGQGRQICEFLLVIVKTVNDVLHNWHTLLDGSSSFSLCVAALCVEITEKARD